MDILFNSVFLQHETGLHPESKKRLEAFGDLAETDIENGERHLELIHTPEYVGMVREACQQGRYLDPDTVVSSGSYEAAVHAVGATIMAVERGEFALVRPPGHHAYPSKASGFCVFNNIAIAVEYLAREQGKRVLIFDFDGHLGDGTEKIFYARKDVMYWSLHQYPAFPYGGTVEETGEGEGKGYTINVPLPPKSGDDIFFKAMKALMPIAEQFNPDVVAVSAGFDAHISDPLLDLRLSTGAYYRIGAMLRERFDHIFAVLEGGYNVDVLPKCVRNFINGINGESAAFEDRPTDSLIQVIDEFDHRMADLRHSLELYWKI